MKKSDAAIQEARAVFAEFYTEPYNEVTHHGDLRHIMTRVGKSSGELMLVLITRTLDFPNKEAIVEQLKKTRFRRYLHCAKCQSKQNECDFR